MSKIRNSVIWSGICPQADTVKVGQQYLLNKTLKQTKNLLIHFIKYMYIYIYKWQIYIWENKGKKNLKIDSVTFGQHRSAGTCTDRSGLIWSTYGMYNQNQVQNHHDRMKENSDNIMFHNDKDYSMP